MKKVACPLFVGKLEEFSNRIRKNFDRKEVSREKGLALSRKVIKASGNAIKAAHREEFKKARVLLGEAKRSLINIGRLLGGIPDIYYSGFVQNAQKEYVEALVTLALIQGKDLPDPDEIKVDYASYLNGIGEAVGELRRHILDIIREGRIERGEEFLAIMDEIYYLLVSFDYTDAITLGLRRTTDIARGVMEKTRGDLTNAIRQSKLEKRLKRWNQ